MKTYTYKETVQHLDKILKRDEDDSAVIRDQVIAILEDVKKRGDRALLHYTEDFDGVVMTEIRVSPEEIETALAQTSPEMLDILKEAAANIRSFHEKQREETWTYAPAEGITLGQHITPIERVGLYVPGGKAAYPSTVLMDSIPALVAGVKQLTMVTPPQSDGSVNPTILAAAHVAGITDIYKVGGAQAIGALAYGTETIEPVYKIVGPGNIYVALAKKEVFGQVDIDMIAGPSEVLIIADGTANPSEVASDLLSQAEHDEMAMPVLVTTDESFAKTVEMEVDRQIEANLSRKAIARSSIDNYGFIFLTESIDECFDLSNRIAPEHLEILLPEPQQYLDAVQNAGAIFFGPYTPEPLGDYFAGPNHTLPTSGTAKFSSPLGVYDFIKRSSILSYSRDALRNVYEKVARFAESEGLDAHAHSITCRFKEPS